MKLSVIIVSYNVKHYLAQCLKAVEKATEGMYAETIVYDNHSRDDSVGYLSSRFPNVNIIAGNHNLGFATANNFAIRQSEGEYVLLLNPDTIVGENTLREAVDFMDSHPKAGGVGVRMLKTDGTDAKESRRGIPTPMTAFYKMTGLCARHPQSRRFGKYYMGYLPWDKACRIEIISGAFCMLRREALRTTGLLDEDFFMYGEDIDMSYRLLKKGWENWYLPLRILHYKGESTQKSSFRYVHVFYEAMLIFFRKHYGHLSLLLSVPIQAAIYMKATMAFFSMLFGRSRASLGFVKQRPVTETRYEFLTSEANRQRCLDFARKKGLASEFHSTSGRQIAYTVFDASVYSYEEMLNAIAEGHHDSHIAVFYPNDGILITGDEVFESNEKST